MNIAAPISGTKNHRSRWQRLINPVDPKPWHPIAWYVSSVIVILVVPTILFVLLLFAVAGINCVTGLENGYLLGGAEAFALACLGGPV
jgi:hypothetical protein